MSTPTPPSDPDQPAGWGQPSAPGQQPQYGQPSPYGQPPAQPSPYGQQPAQPSPYGQPGPAPYGQQPAYDPYAAGLPQASYPIPKDPDARPTTVAIACWLTIVTAGLSALCWVLIGVAMDWVLSEMEKDPAEFDVSPGDLAEIRDNEAAVYALVAVMVVFSALAIVTAVFALRRHNWARITLVVLSGLTILLGLLLILSFVSLAWVAIGIGVIVLLFTGGANQWYARRPSSWDSAGPGSYGGAPAPYGNPYGTSYGQQGPPQGW